VCLLALGIDAHPDYPLVVAANRDERFSRPTLQAGWWEEHPHILAGQDAEAGGTWLGVTRSGRIAAITNYWSSEPADEQAPSRGSLVYDFLAGRTAPKAYAEYLRQEGPLYNGFNLVFGNVDELYYYSNKSHTENEPLTNRSAGGAGTRGNGGRGGAGKLSPGIHALGNALLNTPWPKVEGIKADLAGILEGRGDSGNTMDDRDSPEGGFNVRGGRRAGGADEGPKSDRKELEEELLRLLERIEEPEKQRDPSLSYGERRRIAESSYRIAFPRFGTLSSTVLLFSRDGHVRFVERSYYPEARVEFDFKIAAR
jgi:uncharacterized protein with NRDE domain